MPSTPFQHAGRHRATVAHDPTSFPPALGHASMSELPSEIEKSTQPQAPLPAMAHWMFCCNPASRSPNPSYAARTVPSIRSPIQAFHAAEPNPLTSCSADTIHVTISTTPDHCDQVLLERVPMLVPHTDGMSKVIQLSRENQCRCLIRLIQSDLRIHVQRIAHPHACMIRQCRNCCTKLETPVVPFIFTS